jgi:NADPH-dependent ferric siderophore reductase
MKNHEITRVRREIVRRTLWVASKQHITPRMLRIAFRSDELRGFDCSSPDDFIKIVLPDGGNGEPVTRYFTPRAWDAEVGELILDFALHEDGPTINWARQAEIGNTLEIAGPLGSTVVSDDFDWYLLVGDATALPSIGRRLESLRPDVPVRVIALVGDDKEQQRFTTSSASQIEWLPSTGNLQRDVTAMRTAVEGLCLPAGDGFIWIAAEVSVARELYNCAVESLRHPKQWIKASAYWTQGKADARERIA